MVKFKVNILISIKLLPKDFKIKIRYCKTILPSRTNFVKLYYTVPHDFLIAKLHDYRLGFYTDTFLFTSLKERKRKLSINNISCLLK